jgi:glycosyltransferase involved in cell wall biosynthesis
MNKKTKVAYITNLPAPYVVDYLNLLNLNFDLKVVFERKNSKDRTKNWFKKDFNFEFEYLKGINLGVENSFKPNIIKFLFQDFDVYICDYSSFSGLFFYIIKLIFFPKKKLIAIIDGAKYKPVCFIKKIIKKIIFSAVNIFISSGKESDNYLIKYSVSKKKIKRYFFTSLFKSDFIQKSYSVNESRKLKSFYQIPDEFTILFVGRFIKLKRIEILLKASMILPFKHNVVLVGGQIDSFTKRLLKKYNNKNLFVYDFIPYNKLREFYLLSNMLYLNSSSEAWGLVVNEALANGLPVLTNSNCVAGIELIKDGINGTILNYNSSNEIQVADKIIDYFYNKNFNKNFVSKTVSKYNLENLSNQLKTIINEAAINE